MSVEQQVDALATSVEILKSAVVSKKATLDASVVDAQSATTQAQAAKANTLSARDQAGAFKDAAYTAAQSAASAVAYQDLTAVELSKAITAVDVFIYDTSKDSDGGAWRHRCAGTSWYREPLNTATRGARREFPAVAVIVAEVNKITIFDGDDPSLPMWMVFEGSWSYSTGKMLVLASQDQAPIKSASMLNATLCVGTNHNSVSGLHIINFLQENCRLAQSNGSGYNTFTNHPNIAKRNADLGISVGNTLPGIVSSAVNEVAMTVLPDAPIDLATGLPVPTIAVATAGGVSVIKDDGAVTNSSNKENMFGVIFNENGDLYYQDSVFNRGHQLAYPERYRSHEFGGDIVFGNLISPVELRMNGKATFTGATEIAQSNSSTVGTNSLMGLQLIQFDVGGGRSGSMTTQLTSSYTTGWMNGDIKGAFLADTDDNDLVGESLVNGQDSNFSEDAADRAAFLLKYPNFSIVDPNHIVSVSGGVLTIDRNAGGTGGPRIAVTTVPSRRYTAMFKVKARSHAAGIILTNATDLVNSDITVPAGDYYYLTFTALTASTDVSIFPASSISATLSVSDFTLVSADSDRSVNAKGLTVNGTITRAPVATGAELVGYSSSASSYLSRDFLGEFSGQSTFALVFWARGNPSSQGFRWFETPGGGTSTAFLNLYFDANTGQPRFVWQGRTSLNVGGDCPPHNGKWAHHVALFQSGSFKHYQNGVLQSSSTHGVTAQLHEFRISPVTTAAMALFRITNTIPTADQIRRIYEDENVLFQESAACTFYGASDAVTALSYDADTGHLHVGTLAGRSKFQGLRRVANTTVPVTTAITAAGGMVVEK